MKDLTLFDYIRRAKRIARNRIWMFLLMLYLMIMFTTFYSFYLQPQNFISHTTWRIQTENGGPPLGNEGFTSFTEEFDLFIESLILENEYSPSATGNYSLEYLENPSQLTLKVSSNEMSEAQGIVANGNRFIEYLLENRYNSSYEIYEESSLVAESSIFSNMLHLLILYPSGILVFLIISTLGNKKIYDTKDVENNLELRIIIKLPKTYV